LGFRAHGGHGVLDEDDFIATIEGSTGGGFDPEVGGDAADDDCLYATAAKLVVELGSVECAPMALSDDEGSWLTVKRIDQLGGLRGRRSSLWIADRSVDGQVKNLGDGNADIDDGCALSRSAAATLLEFSRTVENECGASGRPPMPFCKSIRMKAVEAGQRSSDVMDRYLQIEI
jgi:hypothetical protein